MNSSFSIEWTKEEKEEYATRRMNEMKLKNEKFKQRHAEVEKDRLEAEQQSAAVRISKNQSKKSPSEVKCIEEEDSSKNKSSQSVEREWDIGKNLDQRAEREWDIGKNRDGSDWNESSQQDYKYPRYPKRGGYSDGRRFQRDQTSRTYEGGRREDHRSYDYHNRPDHSRGNYNRQDSRKFESSNYRSENTNTFYPRAQTDSKSFMKGDFKKYPSSNRSVGQQWATSSGSYERKNTVVTKTDSAKVFNDKGNFETQNKHGRVDKWVESVNSVKDWDENEDHRNKSYNKRENSSYNYRDKPQNSWTEDEADIRDGEKKQTFRNKDDRFDHYSSKKSSSYQERNRAFENRDFVSESQEASRKNSDVSNPQRKSFVDRQTEAHIYGESRYNKPRFNERVQNYGSQSVVSNREKSYEKSSTWSGEKTAEKNLCNDESGTWSDVDENCDDANVYNKRNSGSKWKEESEQINDNRRIFNKKSNDKHGHSEQRMQNYNNKSSTKISMKPAVGRNFDERVTRDNYNTGPIKRVNKVSESGTWSDVDEDCDENTNKLSSGSKYKERNDEKVNPKFPNKQGFDNEQKKRNVKKLDSGTWSDQEDDQSDKGKEVKWGEWDTDKQADKNVEWS